MPISNASHVRDNAAIRQSQGVAFDPYNKNDSSVRTLPAVPFLKPTVTNLPSNSPVQLEKKKIVTKAKGKGKGKAGGKKPAPIAKTAIAARSSFVKPATPAQIAKLIEHVKNDDKDKFKDYFRGIAPDMDELISCEVTFQHAKTIKNKKELETFLSTSHETRYPTSFTAHNVKLDKKQDGATASQMYHPTSPDTVPYGPPKNAKGNYRWLNHGRHDKQRASHVKDGNTRQQMVDRAIAYTLGLMTQPPFASNGVVKFSKDNKDAIAAHKAREFLKTKTSGFDPKKKQSFDAKWGHEGNSLKAKNAKGKGKKKPKIVAPRDVSPARPLPAKMD